MILHCSILKQFFQPTWLEDTHKSKQSNNRCQNMFQKNVSVSFWAR